MDLKIRDYVFVNGKVFRNVFVIACVALCPTTFCFAGIVLSPDGGSVVFSGGPNDETDIDNVFPLLTAGKYAGGAAFQGNFYGQSVSSNLWIAENGNLNFNEDRRFVTLPFTDPSVSSRIAPFWDDFQFVSGRANQIVNHSIPGSYLAITWKDVWLSFDNVGNPAEARTTQVVWFEKDMNVNGRDFKKDDIAFGYSGFRDGNIFATIGVSKDQTEFTPIKGDADGLISSSQSNLIPWDDNEFMLFRPKEDGMPGPFYVASRELITAVPEPSSIFLAIGSIALAFAKWRRQILTRLLIRKSN